ncbi:hypothetical protein JUJ52_02695 [Virgibacillus sp. AGTR]|uniref:hypothetical protein n=1 Tax=Virgibacillus sp. AGTR TaxID=2812055 RepID=UPI001D163F6F|nr:hypothetical protein [Virgibacillus sp. AGTR]MCC2248868.1 hypothetical protein [Virgibacillus sp. AGTR]
MDKESKKETAIAVSLSLIPYIGGSIASIYTSVKTNKEIERLEEFYSDVANGIKTLDEKLSNALRNSSHDDEYLAMLIEKLSRKVEIEARKSKINALKTLFVNSLLNGVNQTSYSEIDFFLEVLDSLSEIDIELLVLSHKENRLIAVNEINYVKYNEPYFILASVNKLRNFGLLQVFSGAIAVGAKDNALEERIKVSDLGKNFISFCLQ